MTSTGAWERPPPDGHAHSEGGSRRSHEGAPRRDTHDIRPSFPDTRIQVIELDMMNPVKYYPLTIVSGCTIRGFLYPFTVIKTRMQMQTGKEMYSGTFNALRTIFKTEGIRGYYRGFLISNMLIVSQVCYIAVYENMRTMLDRYGGVHNSILKSGLGGLSASIASQTLIVPIDIISQHLMVLSNTKKGFHAKTTLEGLHLEKQGRFASTGAVIRGIYSEFGVKGFYKGYFTSLAVYGPNSGFWWLFYDIYCGLVSEVSPPWVPRLALQCVAATVGGATTACIMNPMDVIRTRIQVKGDTFVGTVRTLWTEEGCRMFFKGLSARLIQSCTFSFSIILGYETIKRWSLWDQYKGSVRW